MRAKTKNKKQFLYNSRRLAAYQFFKNYRGDESCQILKEINLGHKFLRKTSLVTSKYPKSPISNNTLNKKMAYTSTVNSYQFHTELVIDIHQIDITTLQLTCVLVCNALVIR